VSEQPKVASDKISAEAEISAMPAESEETAVFLDIWIQNRKEIGLFMCIMVQAVHGHATIVISVLKLAIASGKREEIHDFMLFQSILSPFIFSFSR
jgi:DNA-binding LytR/AlgR family response regulator